MSINFDSSKAIYLQLADLIRESIMSGALKSGEAIPSVRQMSAEYRLNPQTILNATQLLVNEGLLEKQRGKGYFVTDLAQDVLKESGVIHFEDVTIPDMIKQAKMFSISKDELCKLVEEKFNK
ncbi:MAG: GntR family transcriptional regulator [Candidatus Neomarinimicrobiota bacterium]|nr:MAG: GntR family transcriptional regulator [Candidatus Neomarinimicrobiota bacterium]